MLLLQNLLPFISPDFRFFLFSHHSRPDLCRSRTPTKNTAGCKVRYAGFVSVSDFPFQCFEDCYTADLNNLVEGSYLPTLINISREKKRAESELLSKNIHSGKTHIEEISDDMRIAENNFSGDFHHLNSCCKPLNIFRDF